MSSVAMETLHMIEMLPKQEQDLAYELIKRLVKAWDPDFTKAAPEEAKRIADAERSGFVSEADVDWDSIGADA